MCPRDRPLPVTPEELPLLPLLLDHRVRMPAERDVSLGFCLGLTLPCAATASGSGVAVKLDARELQV